MRYFFISIIILFAGICHGQVVKSFRQFTDRIDVTLSEGTLSIYPITENTVRIRYNIGEEVKVPELIFTSGVQTPRFNVSDSPSKLRISAKIIIAELDKQSERKLK